MTLSFGSNNRIFGIQTERTSSYTMCTVCHCDKDWEMGPYLYDFHRK